MRAPACIFCFRASWSAKDDEADNDMRQALTPKVSKTSNEDSAVGKKKVKIVIGDEGKPHHSKVAVAATAEATAETSTASNGGISLPEPAAVKRANDLLTKGGLLITIIEGEAKNVRRLELDVKSGILKWKVPKFLFVVGEERVVLKDARIMSTGNLLKIGVLGRSEFLSFEACDENEALAVRDCLIGHAKKGQGKADTAE